MLSSDAAKNQGRKLLRALCLFMLPVIQGAAGQTMDAKEICFGIEADELIAELENFISGIISAPRSQHRSQSIEATLRKDWLDYSEGTNWLWKIFAPDNETTIGTVANGEVNPGQIPTKLSIVKYHGIPQSMPLSSYQRDMQIELQALRKHVTQKMPIRLLCFEPNNGKLNISLFEKSAIYNHLALKLRADYEKGEFWSLYWQNGHKAKYAILSHTWTQTPGELTYGDWQNGLLDDTQPKCQKLIEFCKVAWENHGLTLGWIDTVCINKESSAELDESIRSMYTWYRNADICITYLAETIMLSDMRYDPWFTRGWTFQELVAPRCMRFYTANWNRLSMVEFLHNDKQDPWIQEEIKLATTITRGELENISDASISRRMQLAAKRQVTREEDIAYCLMGIFNVSISTAYGEGADRAFFRLLEEIFRSTKEVSDIFNWAGDRNLKSFNWQPTTSLFPSHPSNYLNRSSNKRLYPQHPIKPLTLTHLGLRTPVLLMPAVPILESGLVHQPVGDYQAIVSIAPFKDSDKFEVPRNYYLLDRRISGPEGLYEAKDSSNMKIKTMTLTFGTLNVWAHKASIHVPKTHLAVLLQSAKKISVKGVTVKSTEWTPSPSYQKIDTDRPIVFDLKKIGNDSEDHKNKDYYELERSELAKHGMELVTLYL